VSDALSHILNSISILVVLGSLRTTYYALSLRLSLAASSMVLEQYLTGPIPKTLQVFSADYLRMYTRAR
jgi:hypothetical protein